MTDRDSIIGRPVAVPNEANKFDVCPHGHYRLERCDLCDWNRLVWFIKNKQVNFKPTQRVILTIDKEIADLRRQLAEVTAHRDRLMELVDPES